MSETVELKLKNSPLAEALLGVNFNLNPGFSGFLLGNFWSKVSDIFPNPVLRVQADDGPRFRLVSANADRSLQILDTGIFLSWLKAPGGEAYPGFQSFFKEFEALYQTFLEYADNSSLPRPIITGGSMGYTNNIEGPADLAEQFLPTVFPDFVWRRGHRAVPLPQMAEFGLTFQFAPEDGLVSAKITGPFVVPPPSPALSALFVLQARVVQDPSVVAARNIWSWFPSAKANLNTVFLDLTSEGFRDLYWGGA